MISRRRILSNSCSQLSQSGYNSIYEEDIWFDTNALISDHINEIVNKYDQLDDEIWGKVICMERNRRIAKAYARSPIITINNGDVGFDGDLIGLSGFQNPYRDPETMRCLRSIGNGMVIAADEDGSILCELIDRKSIYLKNTGDLDTMSSGEPCHDEDIDRRKGKLKYGVTNKIFDMKKFLTQMNRDIASGDIDRDFLEQQCFRFVSFGCQKATSTHHDHHLNHHLLDGPVWVIIINVIALEMLHRNFNLPASCNVSPSIPQHRMNSDYSSWGSVSDVHVHIPPEDEPSLSSTSSSSYGVFKRSFGPGPRMGLNVTSRPAMSGRSCGTLMLAKSQCTRPMVTQWECSTGGKKGGLFQLYNNRRVTPEVTSDLNNNLNGNVHHPSRHGHPGPSFTPDPDSDTYGFMGQFKAKGYLNSVLRHLPISSTIARSRKDNPYDESWKRIAYDDHQDETYTHIYSSICDSMSGREGKDIKEGDRPKIKVKRRTTIPKTLKFFLRKSSDKK